MLGLWLSGATRASVVMWWCREGFDQPCCAGKLWFCERRAIVFLVVCDHEVRDVAGQ